MSSQIHPRCTSPTSYVIFNAGKLALNVNHPTLPCEWGSILYVTSGEKKEHIFWLHSNNLDFPEDGDNEFITTITSLMERGRMSPTVIQNVDRMEGPPVHGNSKCSPSGFDDVGQKGKAPGMSSRRRSRYKINVVGYHSPQLDLSGFLGRGLIWILHGRFVEQMRKPRLWVYRHVK